MSWMDRPTGRVIRRDEHGRPGDLVHIDIKKLGRIPPGGGWRAHGRSTANRSAKAKRRRIGYGYVHSVVDDHSTVAYSEVLDDERADTTVAFFCRACAWFADHGIDIRAVLSDNGPGRHVAPVPCRARRRRHQAPADPPLSAPDRREGRTVQPDPATVGLRPHLPGRSPERRQRLDTWLRTYNHHRHHTAVGGPPITGVKPPRSVQRGRHRYERSCLWWRSARRAGRG